MRFDRQVLAGIPFAVTSLAAASRTVCDFAADGGSGADVHLLNAYSLALAERDDAYRNCLEQAACNFPDGKPLSLLTKFRRERLGQVRGPGFFEAVLDEGRSRGLRHYLLGSTPETLCALQMALERRYPGVKIVGTMSPPFRDATPQELLERDRVIRLALPHVVWVGLGTPKQDFEAARLAKEGGFLAIAVGAAFDFSAGTKTEAPTWMQQLGIEWLYRLCSEPRRLWKRYLVGNLLFLWSVVRRSNQDGAVNKR